MTEVTPTPGSPDPDGTPATPPSNGDATDVWAGLSADNLNFVKGKNFSDMNTAFNSYRELQATFSARSPASNDAPADVAGYDFAEVSDIPEGMAYSTEFEGAFKDWALKAKLPKAAANAIRDSFVNYAKAAHAQQAETLSAAVTQSKVDLVREWGPEEGPTFKRNIELATRAMEQMGLAEHMLRSGAVVKGKDGAVTVADAKAVKGFAKIGQAMFTEDTLYGEAAAHVNPWAEGSENVSMQGRIFKENPQRARALIIASGRQEQYKFQLSKIPV